MTYPKLHVQKREPYGSLYSLCSPIRNIEEERPWVVILIQYLLRNHLEGIAANQAGIEKQLFVTNVKGDGIRVYVNPIMTITDYDEEIVSEHCGSHPRSDVERYRHAHVLVDYLSMKGEREFLDTSDPKYPPRVAARLSARLQHEMEHLCGLNVRCDPQKDEPCLEDFCQEPVRVSELVLDQLEKRALRGCS